MDENFTTVQLATRDQATVQRLATWLVTAIPTKGEWLARTLDFRLTQDGVQTVCSQVTVDGGDRVEWLLPTEHGAAKWIQELHSDLTSPSLGSWTSGRLEVLPDSRTEFSVAVVFRFEGDDETF